MNERTGRTASALSLLTSGGTLICCALPALLVSIGAGAALSSLVTAIPQLIWFSLHKDAVFGIGALTLLAAGALQWHARSLPCPLDPALSAACTATRRKAVRLYWVSVIIYGVGVFFAFLAPLF